MGLRLYQAPVESDIQSKPGADKNTSRQRSAIRRPRNTAPDVRSREARTDRDRERGRIPLEVRERRYRLLAATSGREVDRRAAEQARRALVEAASVRNSASNNTSAGEAVSSRRVLRDMVSRMGILDDRVVAMFGERWDPDRDSIRAASLTDGLRDGARAVPLVMAVESEYTPRLSQGNPPSEPYPVSNIRAAQRETQREAQAANTIPPALPPMGVVFGASRVIQSPAPATTPATAPATAPEPTGSAPPPQAERPVPMEPSPFPPAGRPFLGLRVSYRESGSQPNRADRVRRLAAGPVAVPGQSLDGLGDRNRSLSPEGDHVWDTLLSTLTPDPQPPSLGSSFASASASAVASQSNAAVSSRTSFTGLDATEESAFEPPCESVCDNSETEGDEDEDDQNGMSHIAASLAAAVRRRSYADVTRSDRSSEDPLEVLGGIGNMQRIVRNLARREDIPDEWWAEVGLSRMLSREGPSH